MLKEQAKLINRLTKVCDLVLVVTAFLVAYYVRTKFPGRLTSLDNYIWVLFIAIPAWLVSLNYNGLYHSLRRYSYFDVILRLLKVHFYCGLALSALVLFVDRDHFSRGLILFFILFSFLLITTLRISSKFVLSHFRRRGFNLRNCLVVGTQEKAKEFIRLLEDHADWGIRVAGFVQVSSTEIPSEILGYKVLGRIDQVVDICKENLVDEVVFCIPKNHVVNVEDYLAELETLGVTVRLVLDFFNLSKYKTDLSVFEDRLPILTFHTKSLDAQQLMLKRLLDIFGSLIGLLILIIIFPFIAISIKLEDPGPIFFCQERVGENGRKFCIWKFRSMYVDAEERKEELLAQNEMTGAIFKIKKDPRITKVGNILRKTSLDEIPQFWNVLKGDMSLVGTRPPTPDEVSEYDNWHRRRISIKPGITGMWQVNGRNNVDDFDEIVKLDLIYIDTWNLWLDIMILLKTVRVVFARNGSC